MVTLNPDYPDKTYDRQKMPPPLETIFQVLFETFFSEKRMV